MNECREIIICEKDFSAADELCAYLLDGLGFSEVCGLAACPEIAHLVDEAGLEIHGAIYHTHSGVVDFLP